MRLPFAKAATAVGRAAPRSGGRRLFLTPLAPLLVGLLLSTCRSASASCWQGSRVMATGQAIAGQSFPELQGRLPLIVVCPGSDFGPNVGGDCNGGDHRIRIPDWQVQSGRLASVLQHEFCHAAVAVQGQDDGRAQGHGVGLTRCLSNRGLQGEAVR
jgi:hypothetical protein